MRKAFLFLLFIMLFPISVFAGIGNTDDRYYVTDEMWATEPYKRFVLLISHVSETYVNVCTGQYVSPNLILSAGHCLKKGATYTAHNYNQKDFDVELLDKEYVSTGGNDWAVFFVKDSQYYSDAYFDISLPSDTENYVSVLHAGYGWMRILTDEEIEKVKKFIKKINLKYLLQLKTRGATLEELAEEIKKSNLDIATLRENYPPRLKASNCQLVLKDCSLRDSGCDGKHVSLKLSENYPNIIATTCDSMNGDSGGGYIGDNGSLYGIVSYGSKAAEAAFDDNKEFSYASSSLQFKDKISDLISKYPASYTKNHDIDIPVQDVSSNIAINSDETIDAYSLQFNIEELQRRNSVLSKKQLPTDSEQITNAMVLQIANSITEYQSNEENMKKLEEAYKAAKEKEQSLANRTLTAVTTAAMGIGGMELAMGLSEQKADKEAEQDMKAYLSTFRCSYTDGKSFKGGPDPIELPGGNDEKIMSYRNEYLTLAKDLKERKEALGMKPGIESEEILDKIEMGLYDDESVGITSGVYGSLYRATALNSEEDQAKINADKEASKKRVMGGAIAVGAGAVVGIVGNSLINGKLGELVKGKRSKEEQKEVTEYYTSLSNSSTALMRMKSTGTELSADETNELLQAIRDKFK